MELIKKIKSKNLILVCLLYLLSNCQGQNKKETLNNNIAISSQANCFVRQNSLNDKKTENLIYKYQDYVYEIDLNNESTYDIVINKKKYLLNLTLESPLINFYYYKCNDKKIILVEGDDYYGSVFFAYHLVNDKLFYLGNFNIEQPNVENTGVLKKDFIVSLNDNEISLQVLLDKKIEKKIVFNDKKEIKRVEDKNIIKKEIYSIIGRWQLDCDEPQYIRIQENEAFFPVINNQLAINLIKLDKSTDSVYYYKLDKKPRDMGRGGASLNWNTYINDKEVVVIKILDQQKIEFNWLGFYNKSTKKRELTDCDLSLASNGEKVILTRCD
ncbi:MAG TPA: hypothetical protein VF677_11075 [Flavobacterium sp.]|jgi:hypothetical protein